MFRNVVLAMVAMAGLFGASAAKADPVKGNIDQYSTAKSESFTSFKIELYGNEPTRIRVNGNGNSRLTLGVSDEFGNLMKPVYAVLKDEVLKASREAALQPATRTRA